MNDYDKANLNFILSITESDTFQLWYDSLSEDDVAYALELMSAARLELDMRVVELCDDVTDLSDANQVLQKYRLS